MTKKYYFSICAIMKDEHLYAEEFVAYHMAVGCEKFFLYDNESSIPLKETLKKYIEAGIVDVIDFPGRAQQNPAYAHCIKNFAPLSTFVAYIDTDEYLVPKPPYDTVPQVLKEYEQFGGLVVNWMFFSSGGLEDRPNGLVIENYTKSANKNWCLLSHIKTISYSDRVEGVGGDPHFQRYKNGFYAVNEKKERVNGSITNHCQKCLKEIFSQYHEGANNSMEKIQLNHYYTKSLEEFMIRLHRTPGHIVDRKGAREMHAYSNILNIAKETNTDILRFVDKTKEIMEKYK